MIIETYSALKRSGVCATVLQLVHICDLAGFKGFPNLGYMLWDQTIDFREATMSSS